MSATATHPWPLKMAPFDVAKRVLMWAISGLTILSGYGLAKLEPLATSVYLPMTSVDEAVPLLPWTVWIYGSGTVTCLVAWLMVPDRLTARRLYFTLTMSALLCWIFFFLYPTTYPRELWPLPPGETATLWEFADLRSADTASNCFPSQHVALAWGLALCWVEFLRHRWTKPLPILWAVAVSVTTLTTKQHYLIDIPAGMAIGAVSWWVCRSYIRPRAGPATALPAPVRLTRDQDIRAVAAMRKRVEAHQWSLDDIPWPDGPLPPLEPTMARLLNQVIYIEEIAGLNFAVLSEASGDDDLRTLYALFADEERRHADGLRKVLALHGHALEPPGLGCALVLDQFDTLEPRDAADAALLAVSTPVFETFLDAGTIPFLQKHPAIQSDAFDALVDRINRDEGAHIALDWLITREHARRYRGLAAWRFLVNPSVYRGILAVPFMALDVYALAYRLGFDFRTLLPAFGRIWRLHRRYPELAWFGLWHVFRLFVVCGVIASSTVIALHHLGLMFGWFWVRLTRLTDYGAWALFGESLLRRRGLPDARLGSTA